MISIVLIGTGNVARHLLDTFRLYQEIRVVQVLGRNEKNLAYFREFSKTSSDFEKLLPADLYIIAVSDDAIPSVSQLIRNKNGIVVHTSGSVSLDVLSKYDHRGVFYPLQTFSKERKIDFKNVPICLESNQREDMELLKTLAHHISEQVYEISFQQRRSLHLAAVFVNNFTNHLYQIGNRICEENKVSFDILEPLILETAHKIKDLSPHDAQTGPAKRGDKRTIKQHMEVLGNSGYRKIYELLSQSIEREYSEWIENPYLPDRGIEKK